MTPHMFFYFWVGLLIGIAFRAQERYKTELFYRYIEHTKGVEQGI